MRRVDVAKLLLALGVPCSAQLGVILGLSSYISPAGFAIVASGLQQCLTAGDGTDSVDVKKMEKLFLSLA